MKPRSLFSVARTRRLSVFSSGVFSASRALPCSSHLATAKPLVGARAFSTLDDLLEELKKKEAERKVREADAAKQQSEGDTKQGKSALDALSNIVRGDKASARMQQQKADNLAQVLGGEKKTGGEKLSDLLNNIFDKAIPDEAEKMEAKPTEQTDEGLKAIYEEDEEREPEQEEEEEEQGKLRLEDLKYFGLYPKRVREWVVDCKTPRGFWNAQGVWSTYRLLPSPFYEPNPEDAARALSQQEGLRRDFEKKKATPLPPELRGKYRFGVTEGDLQAVGAGEELREMLSFRHATKSEILKEYKRQAIERWGKDKRDSGATEAQIAILTKRIQNLTDHLRRNRKDMRSKRAVHMIADQRRKLLRYLKGRNVESYYMLLKELNLRDVVIAPFSRTWR